MSAVEPVHVIEAVRGLEGRWVAMRGKRVVCAADTFDQLYDDLLAAAVRDTTILRIPREEEPEPVGFG